MTEISDKSFAELKLHDHGEPYFVTFDDYQDVTRTHRLGKSDNSYSRMSIDAYINSSGILLIKAVILYSAVSYQ